MDDETVPFRMPGGLWAAILEDAGQVEIVLKDGSGPNLRRCTIERADRDAVFVTTDTDTLLIPTSSISYVKIPREDWLRKFIRESREAQAPDRPGAPMTMQTEEEGGE